MKFIIKIIFLIFPYVFCTCESENNKDFIYPYSTNENDKRKEIWDNLQKGILLENEIFLIPWNLQYSKLDKHTEKRIDRGDRTEWYLGKHIILDGFECHLEITKWSWLPWSNNINEIYSKIGSNKEGYKKFLNLKNKFTELLGKPVKIDLEKFGSLEIGEILWEQDKIQVSLQGFEVFECKYKLEIRLKN